MRKTLKGFYKAYHAWIIAGAPDGKPFNRMYGLCSNLGDWCDWDGTLIRQMKNQFADAGLHLTYPFDGVSLDTEYLHEASRKTMHLNPARIKWVEEHAK